MNIKEEKQPALGYRRNENRFVFGYVTNLSNRNLYYVTPYEFSAIKCVSTDQHLFVVLETFPSFPNTEERIARQKM